MALVYIMIKKVILIQLILTHAKLADYCKMSCGWLLYLQLPAFYRFII